MDQVSTWPVRVYYEDTDAGGVVYYANYLKFMERARTEFLRGLGYEQDRLAADEGVLFVVRHVEIDYHLPARFNQLLQIVTRVVETGRARLVFEQHINYQDRCLTQAKVTIACIDAGRFRPRAIPESMRKELQRVC